MYRLFLPHDLLRCISRCTLALGFLFRRATLLWWNLVCPIRRRTAFHTNICSSAHVGRITHIWLIWHHDDVVRKWNNVSSYDTPPPSLTLSREVNATALNLLLTCCLAINQALFKLIRRFFFDHESLHIRDLLKCKYLSYGENTRSWSISDLFS